MSRLKFSLTSLMLLTAAIAVCFSWISKRTAQVNSEKKVLTELMKHGVEITETVPLENFVEKLLGQQLKLSRYKVRLRYNQNQHLYDLTEFANLEELTISLHGNLVNLMQFTDFQNLKRLLVHEWYAPMTLDGVQALTNLEYLKISNAEVPEKIDLSALADHPTLQEFWIDGWPLDKSKQFQVFPDW